ncbi:MAG: hypothetical protein JWN34_2538 [Bryobacterales bacterium]|nr:hypothetical protein [Bryobacterales bacterium]
MATPLTNGIRLLSLFGTSLLPLFGHSYGPAAKLTAAPGDNPVACTACHAGTLNSGPGSVAILMRGGPVYIPGVKQRISVRVADPNQQRWGFELTARLKSSPESGQAGQLVPVDNFTQVICEDNTPTPCSSGVSFVQHTSAGTRNGTRGGATFQFDWFPPTTDVGPVTLYAAGNAANGNGTNAGDLIYTTSLELNSAIPAAPAVPAGNVISAATYTAGPVAANSWMTIYGTNLGVTTRAWDESDFINGGMPVALDGVSVLLNGSTAPRRATVGFVSPNQVNFLLPSDVNPATVQVQVRNPAGISAQVPITVQATAPQLLTVDGRAAVAFHANGTAVANATPATPGETISLYCTGCGATTPPLIPSQVPVQAAPVATLPTVTIAGAAAAVSSTTVVPASPGVYEVKVQVPASAANGDLPTIIQLGTFSSASVLVTVQK